MPSRGSLDWLLTRLRALLAAATDAYADAYPEGADAWQAEVAAQLARYHAAAYLAGSGVATLSGPALVAVERDLAVQLAYLRAFGVAIQDAPQWQRGWAQRAQSYADAIQVPYWRGAVRMLPLPALPGDGTSQCLTHCRCFWDVTELDGDNNYDCTWVLGAAEHCQTCRQRAAEWAPLRIREGRLR